MVKSFNYGPLAIGGEGIYYLRDGKVEGENPLANFGPHVVQHLLRTDEFKFSPDILVNSFYDPDKNEVAAFEELIGSHGGIGGEQSYPFIMHPVEWILDHEIVGAEELHRIIKGFLVTESQNAPQADRHVGICREIEIDLHLEDRAGKPARRHGCVRFRQDREHFAQNVRNQNLFAKAQRKASHPAGKVVQRRLSCQKFIFNVGVLYDRACNKLRKAGDIEQ